MTRILRNTESPILYRQYQNKLIKWLRNRGYPRHILKILRSMTHNKRLLALERIEKRLPIERPLPFITEYSHYQPPLNLYFVIAGGPFIMTWNVIAYYPTPNLLYSKIRETLEAYSRRKEGNSSPKDTYLHWICEVVMNLYPLNLTNTKTRHSTKPKDIYKYRIRKLSKMLYHVPPRPTIRGARTLHCIWTRIPVSLGGYV